MRGAGFWARLRGEATTIRAHNARVPAPERHPQSILTVVSLRAYEYTNCAVIVVASLTFNRTQCAEKPAGNS